ncbi:methionyl-tRNA synthetase [Nematocida sp. LUAm3]|nr:methionyl-tRNA synthetase [Nematocida sp. LUAm3]KAI5174067.1 methionyl-tRNA synthetase [Nematocida sp. LUAm2]KAI5177190.1 methionyl-tRNA synthetase [Nematocida sp. LUAm1]
MQKNKKLITSALPYVNNLPHLGNISGSLLSADVFTRYSRARGYETTFICGTDEYGTASEVAADTHGVSPSELCATNSEKHKEIYDWFTIHFDHYGRTSQGIHKEITQKIFLDAWNNGYFTEKTENRFFCDTCLMFLADRYVNGHCKLCGSPNARGDQCDGCGSILSPDEILSPKCSTCANQPNLKETKHLFFSLNRMQTKISQLIDEYSANWTDIARTIANDWKNKEFLPRCITRDLKYNWGVPVPLNDYSNKVLYVWFDAPIGYISFSEEIGRLNWWTDPSVDLYQFMGKDNVFFHSVFFPAILLSTNSIFKYPKVISSTHYLMYEGGKFSKSQGRGIFGHMLLNDSLGPSGVWRYHLMRTRPETGDSDFSWKEFHDTLHGVLINTIGNLCHRALSYVYKVLGGVLVNPSLPQEIVQRINELLQEYITHMDKTEIRVAIGKIQEIAVVGNKQIQLAFVEKCTEKEKAQRISSILSIIALLSKLLLPIVPQESLTLQNILNINDRNIPDAFTELPNAHRINQPTLLFTPLTEQQIKNVSKYCTMDNPFTIRNTQR